MHLKGTNWMDYFKIMFSESSEPSNPFNNVCRSCERKWCIIDRTLFSYMRNRLFIMAWVTNPVKVKSKSFLQQTINFGFILHTYSDYLPNGLSPISKLQIHGRGEWYAQSGAQAVSFSKHLLATQTATLNYGWYWEKGPHGLLVATATMRGASGNLQKDALPNE